MIPYGKQEIHDEDIEAVVQVLKSDYLTQGPKVPEFERMFAKYCEADYAVASNSATSALHVACLALGLGQEDILWTSANTFVASANCGLYCGATVDLIDIDASTYNISMDAFEQKLIKAKADGKLPKIVVPVHFTGHSCDMKKISKLSKEYGFYVVEDASHAVGAKYAGYPVGSCRYSDITVFSFHPVKIITSGEGGMCITNNPELGRKLKLFRDHGINRFPDLMVNGTEGPWYFEQIQLGYNYRMTDIHAALGISQFARVDEIVQKRREIAEKYNKELKKLPLILPIESEEVYSSYHLYVVRIDLSKVTKSFLKIFNELRGAGVGVGKHYIPVYKHPHYKALGLGEKDFPVTEAYYKNSITLPIYPSLSNDDFKFIIDALANILK